MTGYALSKRHMFRWTMAALVVMGSVIMGLSLWGPASTLTNVTGFGDNPTQLEMHLYVPPQPSPRPAVVLALHSCQVSGPEFHANTRYARLADEHGFLVIFPSVTRASRCWDVHSPAALTRLGGSDPLGLLSMVQYVIAHYRADGARVFVTGHSSGGMMTQLLLGAYPDVFRAGAAFAGVPFGCFAGPTEWNEDCALGKVTKLPVEWGELVRHAYPTFTGARPTLQLWHGTQDDALHFRNFGESIKQWTDVLETGAEPASVDMDTPRNPWTRFRYTNASGEVRLEAFRGEGEPHNFTIPAEEVIRFFGLDS